MSVRVIMKWHGISPSTSNKHLQFEVIHAWVIIVAWGKPFHKADLIEHMFLMWGCAVKRSTHYQMTEYVPAKEGMDGKERKRGGARVRVTGEAGVGWKGGREEREGGWARPSRVPETRWEGTACVPF